MDKLSQRTSFFNGLADKWDDMCPSPSMERLDLIARLACSENGNFSVVDAGSGTGVFIPSLLKLIGEKGRIVALDPAEKMLFTLRQKFSDPRILTKCETLEKCSIEAGSIDAIYCFSCFPHVDDKQMALANSARILKENGRIVIAHVSGREEINDFHKKCSEAVRDDVLPDRDEMTGALSNAGFVLEHYVDETGRYELVARKAHGGGE